MTPDATVATRWQLTPADRVTLTRAGLAVLLAVLVLLSLTGALAARSWLTFGVLVVALLLDLVDGAVARRTGQVTERGARWDSETDAATLLVASLAVATFAPWVLVIGLARYLFWLGGMVRPAWRLPLRYSLRRRVLGGAQGVALAIALAPVVPIWLAQAVTVVALVLLVFSFGRDIYLQERLAREGGELRKRGQN